MKKKLKLKEKKIGKTGNSRCIIVDAKKARGLDFKKLYNITIEEA